MGTLYLWRKSLNFLKSKETTQQWVPAMSINRRLSNLKKSVYKLGEVPYTSP
uniref:Uncharacterized protein n=1 Tax=Rhizophora mucronata TaxID=61149 RepID=A0A2P2N968_RHIMU